MPEPQADGGDRVADAEWTRVRRMAARVAGLEQLEATGSARDEDLRELERLRVRVARAADRALMADDLADRLAEVRTRRR